MPVNLHTSSSYNKKINFFLISREKLRHSTLFSLLFCSFSLIKKKKKKSDSQICIVVCQTLTRNQFLFPPWCIWRTKSFYGWENHPLPPAAKVINCLCRRSDFPPANPLNPNWSYRLQLTNQTHHLINFHFIRNLKNSYHVLTQLSLWIWRFLSSTSDCQRDLLDLISSIGELPAICSPYLSPLSPRATSFKLMFLSIWVCSICAVSTMFLLGISHLFFKIILWALQTDGNWQK